MIELLNVNTIFFTVLGYPMSYIEFFGTILNIACVYLVARKNILTWPVGITAVLLFGALFYQIQLYSDVIEQAYYLITGLYGWWVWTRYKRQTSNHEHTINVRYSAPAVKLVTGTLIVAGTIGLGYFMSNIHLYWPHLFPEAAAFPYLDAFTTVMSFAAQLLMIYRYIENWMLWIAVDIIGIGLYAKKGVLLVSLLYVIFLCIAIRGLIIWRRERTYTPVPTEKLREAGTPA